MEKNLLYGRGGGWSRKKPGEKNGSRSTHGKTAVFELKKESIKIIKEKGMLKTVGQEIDWPEGDGLLQNDAEKRKKKRACLKGVARARQKRAAAQREGPLPRSVYRATKKVPVSRQGCKIATQPGGLEPRRKKIQH